MPLKLCYRLLHSFPSFSWCVCCLFFISHLSLLILVMDVFYVLLLLWSVLLNIYPLYWSLQISILVIFYYNYAFKYIDLAHVTIVSFLLLSLVYFARFFFGFSESKRKVSLFIWDSSWNQWWAKEVIKILWGCFPEFSLFFDLCSNFLFPMVPFFILPVVKMELL